MRVEVERREDGEVGLKISLEPEAVQKEVEKVFKEAAKTVTVPGFRPGKAPRAMIESHLNMVAVIEEAKDRLARISYFDALNETGLEPVDRAELSEGSVLEDGSFAFEAKVTVMPEVQLGEYKGLKATKPVAKVDDAAVTAEIERFRQRFLSFSPAPERPIEKGDVAIIDYALEVDGENIDNAAVNGYPLEVGADTLFPQLNEALLGVKQGEERRIEGTLPESYPDPDLAGKDAVFVVTVKEVKASTLPELDDEFARRIRGVESLEDLRQKVRENLEQSTKALGEATVRESLITQLMDASEVELPSVLVQRFRESREREVQAELARHGATLDAYLAHEGISFEQWKETVDREARRSLKRFLILRELVKAANVEVSDAEMAAEIERQAVEEGVSTAVKKREIQSDAEARQDLVNVVAREKAIKALVEAAEITEEEIAVSGQEDTAEAGAESSAEAGTTIDAAEGTEKAQS